MLPEIQVEQLARRLAGEDPPALLDVRETEELHRAALPGVLHVPLALLPLRVHELDPTREWVVLCHHGIRSAMAARYLAGQGFDRVVNLSGGIDAWSVRIDPSLPRY
jgi:rhodanese-related sulfurtransferase